MGEPCFTWPSSMDSPVRRCQRKSVRRAVVSSTSFGAYTTIGGDYQSFGMSYTCAWTRGS